MIIDLSSPAAIDVCGVKRWRFEDRDFVLEIKQRPKRAADRRYEYEFYGPTGRRICRDAFERRSELMRAANRLADAISSMQ